MVNGCEIVTLYPSEVFFDKNKKIIYCGSDLEEPVEIRNRYQEIGKEARNSTVLNADESG
jgi:hypothetical protein